MVVIIGGNYIGGRALLTVSVLGHDPHFRGTGAYYGGQSRFLFAIKYTKYTQSLSGRQCFQANQIFDQSRDVILR